MRTRLIRGGMWAVIAFFVVGGFTGKWLESLAPAVTFGIIGAIVPS